MTKIAFICLQNNKLFNVYAFNCRPYSGLLFKEKITVIDPVGQFCGNCNHLVNIKLFLSLERKTDEIIKNKNDAIWSGMNR